MGTYESLFCLKRNATSVVVTCEVVGTLNHYKMVKKFELCTFRGGGNRKNFSIISSSLVLGLELVLELALVLGLELELELELVLVLELVLGLALELELLLVLALELELVLSLVLELELALGLVLELVLGPELMTD